MARLFRSCRCVDSLVCSVLVSVVAAGLSLGCATVPAKPSVKVVRIDQPPGDVHSLGEAGVFFEISNTRGKEQQVTIPISTADLVWLDPSSARLARWQEDSESYQILADSFFCSGPGHMEARVSSDGRYAIFGYSALPHVNRFQRRICGLRGLRLALTPRFLPSICLAILCPNFDAAAWSRAYRDQSGLPIDAGMVTEHFGNLCDLCLGRDFGPGDFPECHIPPEIIVPPALEQMPLAIPHGGRAVAIAIDPADDDRMVVASETGGLFRTANRAVNWRHVSADLTFDFTDVQYHGTDSEIVVASARRDTWTTSRGGIWRSENAGTTWSQASAVTPTPECLENWDAFGLDYEPEDGRFWVATRCGVAFSADAGATWQYLPVAPGYTNDDTRAVVAPAAGHLKILTGSRVKVTEDGGASWSMSTSGLPLGIQAGVHNQIAVSPFEHRHIYFAFNYWVWDSTAREWDPNWAFYLSTDNGSTWSPIFDTPGINRPPFVRTALSLSGEAGEYDLYFGTGGCTLRRAVVAHGIVPAIGAWTDLTVDHCDASDLAFANDGATPLLLASDGGLHVTADDGLSWTYAGDMGRGYNALQITEVTGQLSATGGASDLYFGTQDNELWASPDEGVTWPGQVCCEGFFLNVERDPLPAADTDVTGVRCAGCSNFISGPIFSGIGGFPNPPNDAGNPRLIKPETYVHRTRIAGVEADFGSLTTDTGALWTTRWGSMEPWVALPEVAGDPETPTIFTAVQRSGTTPDGVPVLGIKRIDDVLGSGAPIVSDVTGFGSLGTFPTMFAWYKPYGVDPDDPDFMIVPDIVADQVAITEDGGMMWTPNASITDLVTRSGSMRFHWGVFGQVSSIGFDPDCEGHILVGTQQSGVLRSFDHGTTWHRVAGTLEIPRVSRFFFAGDEEVILSSYGRGLWRLRYTCPGSSGSLLDRFRRFATAVVYINGRLVPLARLDVTSCEDCRLFVAHGGTIVDLDLDETTRILKAVFLSAGSLEGADNPPFDVSIGNSKQAMVVSEDLRKLLAAGNEIRGVYLEGSRLRGLVLASDQVDDAGIVLPEPQTPGPRIRVDSASYLVGRPIAEPGGIVVTGRGFHTDAPLRVLVDGEPIEFDQDLLELKDDGSFRLVLAPVFELGGHTILIEQDTDDGALRGATTFHLTVQDFPRGNPRNPRR